MDARTSGKRKTTLVSISNINNEQALYGKGYHSPKDHWSVAIFYFGDERVNLESNIGCDGELIRWISSMHRRNHKIYMSADSVAQDAIVGGDVGALTDTGFNIYMKQDKADKKNFEPSTGRRSDLNKKIDREHKNKLLDIPISQFAPCIDHGITRITEHLITLLVTEIHRYIKCNVKYIYFSYSL